MDNISERFTLRDYGIILFRRRTVFAVFFFTLVISVIAASFLIKPLFSAETVLLIEKSEDEPLVSFKVPITDFADRMSLLSTQTRFIKSRNVLESVVKEFSLHEELPLKGKHKFEKAIIFLKKKVKVSPIKNADFVSIQLKLENKAIVAPVVNAIANNYISYYFETKNARSSKVQDFVDVQMKSVKKDLNDAENALMDYETANGIVSIQDEARIFLEKLLDAQKRLTYLLIDYKDTYPDVVAARLEIENIEKRLENFSHKKMDIRRLQYAVENLEGIYLMLLEKREELRITAEMEKEKIGQIRNIEVIEPAQEPLKPVWPKKRVNVMLALFIGFFGGISVVFWVNYLDPRFYSRDDVKKHLGTSVVESVSLSDKIPSFIDNFDASVFKMYQGLFNSMKTFVSSPIKTLLVTSASRGEGKTTTALNLALVLSKVGRKKVLLVDANVEHPCLHRILKAGCEPGLVGYLDQENAYKDIISRTNIDTLFFIPSAVQNDMPKSLNFDKIKDLLADLKKEYDYIIFDSPGCAVHAGAPAMAPFFDYTLFVVRAGETRQKTAKQAMERLRSVDLQYTGIMINCRKYDLPEFLYKRI